MKNEYGLKEVNFMIFLNFIYKIKMQFKITNAPNFIFHENFLEKFENSKKSMNLDKILYLLNKFSFVLNVEEILLTSLINFEPWFFFLKIDGFLSEFSLQTLKFQQIFRINLHFSSKNLTKAKIYEGSFNLIYSLFFNLKISNFFYPIPIFLYNIKLLCHFYRVTQNFNRLIRKSYCSAFSLDLGHLKVKETTKYLLLFENINPEQIIISTITLANLSKISYEIEGVSENFDENDRNFSLFNQKFLKTSKISIPEQNFLLISLSLTSVNEEKKSSFLEFFMNEVLLPFLFFEFFERS